MQPSIKRYSACTIGLATPSPIFKYNPASLSQLSTLSLSLFCMQMCEDVKESRLHACEREQQDIDFEPDAGENKEVVQPARHSKDARLCHRNCTRNCLRGKAQISRVLRPIRKLAESRGEHKRRLQCYTWRSILLRLPHFSLHSGECHRNTLVN